MKKSKPLGLAFFVRKPITFGLCFLRKTKNHARWRGFVLDVTQGGFEPPTLRAEILYSIQLNYWAMTY